MSRLKKYTMNEKTNKNTNTIAIIAITYRIVVIYILPFYQLLASSISSRLGSSALREELYAYSGSHPAADWPW
jgi:hypothetical protein